MLRERLKVQDEQKKIGELRNEVNRIAHLTDNANATLKNQQMELQKLKHILEEADLEKRKQRKELDVAADRHDQIADQRSLLQAETKKIEADVKKNEAAEKKLHMKEAKIARSIRDIENQMDAQETVQATQADEVCPNS